MTKAGLYEGTSDRETRAAVRRFCRAAHVQQAEQAGAIILFDGKQYYTLPNEAASDLWVSLGQPSSAEELVGQLYDRFDAPREVIAEDVRAQLALLLRERLVVEVGAAGEPLDERLPWWRFWRPAR